MIVARAKKAHTGVTHLAYVSGVDGLQEAIGGAGPLAYAARDGLLTMGLATLLGASPGTARLAGLIGAGVALATRK